GYGRGHVYDDVDGLRFAETAAAVGDPKEQVDRAGRGCSEVDGSDADPAGHRRVAARAPAKIKVAVQLIERVVIDGSPRIRAGITKPDVKAHGVIWLV